MIIKGAALCYGHDISTDEIIPGPYLQHDNPEKLASFAMRGCDITFPQKSKNAIMVVGKNFGCGSSREQATICLKYAGIQAIIGISFARIFYRNAINQGLPLFQSSSACEMISNDDEIKITLETGEIMNISTQKQIQSAPPAPFLTSILKAGGAIPWFHQQKKHD